MFLPLLKVIFLNSPMEMCLTSKMSDFIYPHIKSTINLAQFSLDEEVIIWSILNRKSCDKFSKK